MRKYLPEFEYIEPDSLNDMLNTLNSLRGEAKILAGGTDLITAMREKGIKPRYVISSKKLSNELKYIRYDEERKILRIGALTTIRMIETSKILKDKYYVLMEAASVLGSYQIRNRATIGGNLCNASPAADMAPPLMVLDAKLNLISSKGERKVPIEEFFLGPGKTILADDEILREIEIPEPDGRFGSSFVKISRRMIGLAIVNAASFVKLKDRRIDDIRIALGAVAPTPVRATTVEEELRGKEIDEIDLPRTSELVENDISPISDVRASAEYRKHISRVLVKRSLEISIRRAVKG